MTPQDDHNVQLLLSNIDYQLSQQSSLIRALVGYEEAEFENNVHDQMKRDLAEDRQEAVERFEKPEEDQQQQTALDQAKDEKSSAAGLIRFITGFFVRGGGWAAALGAAVLYGLNKEGDALVNQNNAPDLSLPGDEERSSVTPSAESESRKVAIRTANGITSATNEKMSASRSYDVVNMRPKIVTPNIAPTETARPQKPKDKASVERPSNPSVSGVEDRKPKAIKQVATALNFSQRLNASVDNRSKTDIDGRTSSQTDFTAVSRAYSEPSVSLRPNSGIIQNYTNLSYTSGDDNSESINNSYAQKISASISGIVNNEKRRDPATTAVVPSVSFAPNDKLKVPDIKYPKTVMEASPDLNINLNKHTLNTFDRFVKLSKVARHAALEVTIEDGGVIEGDVVHHNSKNVVVINEPDPSAVLDHTPGLG